MKTVLITGASRGIGRQTALRFGNAGYNVAVHYNSHEKEAQEICAEIGRNAFAVQADLRSADAVEKMLGAVYERFGRIDVLVNNAGIARQELFIDSSEEVWKDIFDVNVHGMYRVTKCVLKEMLKRKQGTVINVSSMWGEVGASCEVAYSATKAAVDGFTKALAKEVGPSGIRVNAVAPGVILTDMTAHLGEEDKEALAAETPLERIGKPEDVASLILYLAGEEAAFITGQIYHVNGGFCIY